MAGTAVTVNDAAAVVAGAAIAGIGGVAGTVTTGATVVVGAICGVDCDIGVLLFDAADFAFCALALLTTNSPKAAVKIKAIFFISLLFNSFI
jgi:hypothetical protein